MLFKANRQINIIDIFLKCWVPGLKELMCRKRLPTASSGYCVLLGNAVTEVRWYSNCRTNVHNVICSTPSSKILLFSNEEDITVQTKRKKEKVWSDCHGWIRSSEETIVWIFIQGDLNIHCGKSWFKQRARERCTCQLLGEEKSELCLWSLVEVDCPAEGFFSMSPTPSPPCIYTGTLL